jgi:hypothetical protein
MHFLTEHGKPLLDRLRQQRLSRQRLGCEGSRQPDFVTVAGNVAMQGQKTAVGYAAQRAVTNRGSLSDT